VSGLSIAAFCRERKVPAASFYHWRRKLADRESLSGEDATAKFVPVELPALPDATLPDATLPDATRASCEVVLPDGCRIIVPTQCDASWLREILVALEGRAC
jgi:hypothetical protein